MILECPSCHARYVVPIGLFASGGRQVRCARCKHEWHAALPTTIDVFETVPQPIKQIQRPSFKPSPETSTVVFPSSDKPPLQENSGAGETAPPSAMMSLDTQALIDAKNEAVAYVASQLPVLASRWGRLKTTLRLKRRFVLMGLGALVVFALVMWPILEREGLVKNLPWLRGFYESIGLYVTHAGKGLVFNDVKSELKYDGGTMRLYVDGVIHNSTHDIQFLPDIMARALGPDRHIIQSWWVPSPAPTIAPEADVPFHTEVNVVMNHTIQDVYLEFYSQDEKGDVAH